MKQAATSFIELLEPRYAPAALTATLTDGLLTITGDPASGNNSVTILQEGPDSFLVLDGIATVGGGTFDGVANIALTTEGADDLATVQIRGGFAGAIKINTAGGADELHVVAIADTKGKYLGAMTYNGGAGDDEFSVESRARLLGSVVVRGAETGDRFSAALGTELGDVRTKDVHLISLNAVVRGSLLIDSRELASGGSFSSSPSFFAMSGLTYKGSTAGTDFVTLGGVFNGPVRLEMGDGSNGATIGSTSSSVALFGSFKYLGGSSNDNVTITSSIITGGSGAVFAKRPNLTLGEGGNTVTVQGPGADFRAGLLAIGGSGDDNFSLGTFGTGNYNGAVELIGGGGTNTVTFGGAQLLESLTYTGGGGVDTVNLFLSAPLLHAELRLKGGNDVVNGNSVTVLGSLTLLGGAGTDTVKNTQFRFPMTLSSVENQS